MSVVYVISFVPGYGKGKAAQVSLGKGAHADFLMCVHCDPTSSHVFFALSHARLGKVVIRVALPDLHMHAAFSSPPNIMPATCIEKRNSSQVRKASAILCKWASAEADEGC